MRKTGIIMNYSSKLNEFDILDLLNEYHSEMRKLKHKAAFVNSKIAELERELEHLKNSKQKRLAVVDELESFLEDISEEPKEVLPEKAAQKEAQKAVTKKSTGKKQRKKPGRKPQPLSQWDQMIYDSVAENGRIMLSRDIYFSLEKKAKEAGVFLNEEHARVKLNQCLVKMTNEKRMDLHKVNHPGRGFAYALPQWVDRDGNAMEAFQLLPEKAPIEDDKTQTVSKKSTAKSNIEAEKAAPKVKRKRIVKTKPEASSVSPKMKAEESAESIVATNLSAELPPETP